MCFNFAGKGLLCAIIISTFVFVLAANELNLYYIKTINPQNSERNMIATVAGFTVWSVDNEWYLPQIKNFLNGDGFTLDPLSPAMKVRRTPGYPAFYGLHYVLFGETGSFFFIRYTQIFLHLLAVLLIGQAVFNLTADRTRAIFSALLYAFNPYTVIYLYATITESISPACVAYIFYAFSVSFKSGNRKNYFLLGAVIGVAVLVRPLLIVAVPAVSVAAFFSAGDEKIRVRLHQVFLSLGAAALGTLLIVVPWAARNYGVTNGEIIFLEKYYDDDPMGFGRGHSAFRDWISCWDNPANTSAERYAAAVESNIRQNLPAESVADDFLNAVPSSVYAVNSRESVAAALSALNDCFRKKQMEYGGEPEIIQAENRKSLACENRVEAEFTALSTEFKAETPARYYLITPLIFLKNIVFQSGSYMIAMIGASPETADTTWQKIFKSLMYVLNAMLYLSLPLYLFKSRNLFVSLKYKGDGIFVGIFVLLTVWLCIFYFRYAESRYFVPCVPLLCVSLAAVCGHFTNLIGARRVGQNAAGENDGALNPS